MTTPLVEAQAGSAAPPNSARALRASAEKNWRGARVITFPSVEWPVGGSVRAADDGAVTGRWVFHSSAGRVGQCGLPARRHGVAERGIAAALAPPGRARAWYARARARRVA